MVSDQSFTFQIERKKEEARNKIFDHYFLLLSFLKTDDTSSINLTLHCISNFNEVEQYEFLSSECPFNINSYLEMVCQYNYLDLAKFFVNYGAKNIEYAFYGACFGGNLDVAKWCVEMGAKNFWYGLLGACSGGNIALAEYCYENETMDSTNFILQRACGSGNIEMVKWCVKKGATNFNESAQSVCHTDYSDDYKMKVLSYLKTLTTKLTVCKPDCMFCNYFIHQD